MANPFSFIISTVAQIGISALFPAEGPRMKDLSVSASTYGNTIPEVWGLVRVGGNMIWSKKIKEHKSEQFGKGGFSITYTYTCDFAMAWAKGPVNNIRRIWADNKLIYDVTGQSTGVDNGKYSSTFYYGLPTQMPDPLIEADKGAGNTPAYRDLSYSVFSNFLLTDFGNRVPQFTAEVYAAPNGPTATTTIEDTPVDTGSDLVGTQQIWTDTTNGLFYIDYSNGLRQYSLATGQELRSVDGQAIGAPATDGTYNKEPGGWSRLMGICNNGTLVFAGPISNYTFVGTVDPVSLTCTGIVGTAQPFNQISPTSPNGGVPYPSISAVAQDASGYNYVLGYGFFGDVDIVKIDPEMAWLGNLGRFGDPTAAKTCCARQTDGGGGPMWYLCNDAGVFAPSFVTSLAVVAVSINPNQTSVAFNLPNPVGFGQMHPSRLAWDSSTDSLLIWYTVGSQSRLAKWNEASDQIEWDVPVPGYPAGVSPITVSNNQVGWLTGTINRLYVVNTTDGSQVDPRPNQPVNPSIAPQDWTYPVEQVTPGSGFELPINTGGVGSPQVYDSLSNNVLMLGGNGLGSIIHVGQYTSQGMGLDVIVSSLMYRAGLLPVDFDVSELSSISVVGYGFASNTDIKGILAELRSLYLFDLVESDGMFKARLRGGDTPDETIKDLVLGSSSPTVNDSWKETRLSEADIPASITLVYNNSDNDFQTTAAHSQRISAPIPTMFSRQKLHVDTSLTMGALAAKTLVNAMLYTQWSERTKHETRLPWAYSYLDPSDLLSINMSDGRNYFERIHQTDLGADYNIQMETYGTDSGTYVTNVQAADGGSMRLQTVQSPVAARPFILNTTLLRDLDDTGGGTSRYYTGVGTITPAPFNGAVLYRSTNNVDYTALNANTDDVEWGTVPTPMPPAHRGAWALDWETQLVVWPSVSWFNLSSITDDQLDQGGNLCMVGAEVLQFRDAVQNANGSWTLTNLYRGRRGTEWACDNHKLGESFIFFSTLTISTQAETLDAINQKRWFKAVGSGMSILESLATQVTYQPRDLMPYAPSDLRRTMAAGANEDIVLTWANRNRFFAGLMDGTGDISLGEATEAYEIYILTGPYNGDPSTNILPTNIKRAYTSTTPTVTYTAADQTTDGYVTDVDTCHVVVYQISAAVGRGFPSFRDIEPWRDL